MKKNNSTNEYFVYGRKMSSMHIGLSVVATDAGGGFSIGLGGMGFVMGLSGSWLLFTGLLGAWMTGMFLILRAFSLGETSGCLTFLQQLSMDHTAHRSHVYCYFLCRKIVGGWVLCAQHRGMNFRS
jgi:SSS family solute:Na+ symporter